MGTQISMRLGVNRWQVTATDCRGHILFFRNGLTREQARKELVRLNNQANGVRRYPK